MEILGFKSQELEAKIAQIENIILSDDKFSISENEDKKSSRSIILSHSISYQDKISSKFSKVLDGLCSTETNRVSEEENKQKDLYNSFEEFKEQIRESENSTPKQLDTIEDECEKREDLEDYEL